jgi:hypothetical protein
MASRSRFGRGRSSHARIPGAVEPAVPRSRALSVAPKASRVGCAITFRGGAPAPTCGRTDAETDRSGAESRRIHAAMWPFRPSRPRSPAAGGLSGTTRRRSGRLVSVWPKCCEVAEETTQGRLLRAAQPSCAPCQSPVTRTRWPAGPTAGRKHGTDPQVPANYVQRPAQSLRPNCVPRPAAPQPRSASVQVTAGTALSRRPGTGLVP